MPILGAALKRDNQNRIRSVLPNQQQWNWRVKIGTSCWRKWGVALSALSTRQETVKHSMLSPSRKFSRIEITRTASWTSSRYSTTPMSSPWKIPTSPPKRTKNTLTSSWTTTRTISTKSSVNTPANLHYPASSSKYILTNCSEVCYTYKVSASPTEI